MDYLNRRYAEDFLNAFGSELAQPIPALSALKGVARQSAALTGMGAVADLIPDTRGDVIITALQALPGMALSKAARVPGGVRIGVGSSRSVLPSVRAAEMRAARGAAADAWAKETLDRPLNPLLTELLRGR